VTVDGRSGGSDFALSAELVGELVGVQFPDLAGAEVRSFGTGWDHTLFSVGSGWLFRFPKRADRVAWLVREIEIMAVAGPSLGDLVPRFELIGSPSADFPYPFVGYRQLPGVGADESDLTDPAGLARDLGHMLGRVHRIDASRIPPSPAAWEHESWASLPAETRSAAEQAAPLLAPSLRAAAEPYLAGEVDAPPDPDPPRFVHNDICAEHVLVDPRTGRLSGLIDFTDAMVGPVVHDFVGLICIGGYDFIEQAAESYDLPLPAEFAAQVRWLARNLTLIWLAEAAGATPGGSARHLTWVQRAFAG
jgi:aminoglycoside phosphotransferase (APT) family kinase protein